MQDGGNAMDAAIATAFALAGNIGGGGFLLYRSRTGDAVAYDFREVAPAKASPTICAAVLAVVISSSRGISVAWWTGVATDIVAALLILRDAQSRAGLCAEG